MSGAGKTVYLGIGSNRGDRESTIRAAIADISEYVSDLRVSPLFETQALYYADQQAFLNCAVTGTARASPNELLELVNETEARHGRDRAREIRNGPRTLDIDILLYGSEIRSTERLIIPHPRLSERKFVLLPLLCLDPLLTHPVTGVSLSEYLRRLPSQGIYYASLGGYSGVYTRRRGQDSHE